MKRDYTDTLIYAFGRLRLFIRSPYHARDVSFHLG
jgi:hypothetical protein